MQAFPVRHHTRPSGEIKNPVPKDEQSVIWPLVGTRMLELGCKENRNGVYKWYFESIGIDHTSIDWNGLYGSLPLDLRKPVDLPPFDMVTNIGTTEHVSEQEPCWRNIHNLTKVGGVIASATPREGDWWWHGEHYPRFEFFEQFAELNGYRIERLAEGLEFPNRNLYARMVKLEDRAFVMPSLDTIFVNERRGPHANRMRPEELEKRRT
jgi:hypothetical protein